MKSSRDMAFTIVELLVVIVIVAILAAVSFVSYSNISSRAVAASLQSDLSNAATQLKLFNSEYGYYPNSITDCPSPASDNLCLKSSGGNIYSSYSPDNSSTPQTFTLTASNSNQIYKITNNAAPTALASAPLSPVADWIAVAQGDHYGNFYDLVTGTYATVTRSTAKTVYDPLTQKIYDVPAGYLAINPRSDGKSGSEAVIEERRANYVLHSYFDLDSNSDGVTDNWVSANSNSTSISSRNTIDSIYGTVQKTRMTHTDGAATGWPNFQANMSSVGSFLNGESATATIWYRNLKYQGTSQVILNLRGYNADASAYYNQVNTILVANDSNWRKAIVSTTFTDVNQSKASVRIQQTQNADGDYFEIEIGAVQLEKGSFATSYIPTTTATATRNADNVAVPTPGWNASAGTAMGIFSQPTSCIISQRIFAWESTDAISIQSDSCGDIRAATYISGTASRESYSSQTLGAYKTFATRWENGVQTYGYLNGTRSGALTAANYVTMSSPPATAGIGNRPAGDRAANTSIQRLTLYASALPAADITTVSDAVKDGY